MIYPFRCKCGHTVELVMTISEYEKLPTDKTGPYKKCPECKCHMHRVLTAPPVIFKGGGWPGKEIKEQGNFQHVIDQKNKVTKAKAEGKVPKDQKFNLKDAEKL